MAPFAYLGQGQKVHRPMMAQTVNLILIFRYSKADLRFQCGCKQVTIRVECGGRDFAASTNLVLDDADEIYYKTKSRTQLGWIVLKGNTTLLQSVSN
ncbi:small nuclear ribonucleoprotein E-like [Peromyscus eremicus]|uniref:small nuclear ribonucleoprotein E-like n=1 Tax=Peromyscus eremicus TaxID=42410 RepID=UPI0027DD74EE|nr:small nuclear ribonucleoprotein E-like [Peromyscus eremicus]